MRRRYSARLSFFFPLPAPPAPSTEHSVQWVFDDDDELVPATALNVERYGDDDAVWYDAVVQKVTPKLVEVFYAEDNETKRHNLLVSGITKKRPKPLGDYLAKGVRWKVKQ